MNFRFSEVAYIALVALLATWGWRTAAGYLAAQGGGMGSVGKAMGAITG